MSVRKQQSLDNVTKALLDQFFRTRDTMLWGKIYELHKKTIYLHCFRIVRDMEDAKDLTSEIFIKAFDKIVTYDRTRPFYPWLAQIATNLCIDHIRRQKRIQLEQLSEENTISSHEDSEQVLENKELTGRIRDAIQSLKRPQMRCFCLFFIQQKSYKEIAALTGYTYQEVRSHIQNGKRNFKLMMEKT